MGKAIDLYAPQLTALRKGEWQSASQTTERATFLIELLNGWDTHRLGDWKDAIAVAARRQDMHSRDPYVLLARYIWSLDARRGSEIGRLAAKFNDRDSSSVSTAIYASGGVKAASKKSFKPHPPKRPRTRKTTSVDAKSSRRVSKTRG